MEPGILLLLLSELITIIYVLPGECDRVSSEKTETLWELDLLQLVLDESLNEDEQSRIS